MQSIHYTVREDTHALTIFHNSTSNTSTMIHIFIGCIYNNINFVVGKVTNGGVYDRTIGQNSLASDVCMGNIAACGGR